MFFGDEAEEAHDDEHDAEPAQAVEVERAAAQADGHEEPGAEDARHVDGVLAHGEGVGLGRVEAGLLEEVRRVVGEGVAAEVLDRPDHADDLGAAAVGAAEAVHVAGAVGDLLLEGRGVDHHGDCFVGVEVGLAVYAGQSEQGLLGLLRFAFADEPPGGLGGERYPDEERHRPHPLETVWDPIRPFIGAGNHGLDHPHPDQLSQPPAEVDIGGQISAQRNGADLGRVGDGQRLEDAPGDTREDLGGEQRLHVGGGEEDCGPRGDQDETRDEGVAISEAFRGPTVDEKTDDFSDVRSIAETGLPLW